MIALVTIFCAIPYAFRRRRLIALAASDFPGVAPETFSQWQAYEIKSGDLLLWATWGLCLILSMVFVAIVLSAPKSAPLASYYLQGAQLILFLILLTFSAIPGSKAAKLKKEHGIKWPK